MAVFTIAATVQQFLYWLTTNRHEEATRQKQEGETESSEVFGVDQTELDVCYQSALDRIEYLEMMEGEHQRELEIVREEERTIYKIMLEEEKSKRQEVVECKVCMEADIQRTFGCGHAACAGCARLLVECHVCRSPIRQVNKLYLP